MKNIIDGYNKRKDLFLQELGDCRKSFSVESVHDVRKTVRKLNSYIQIFDTQINSIYLSKYLNNVMEIISRLREIQVEIDFFENSYGDFKKKKKFLNFLKKKEKKEIEKIQNKLNKLDFLLLNDLLEKFQIDMKIYAQANKHKVRYNVRSAIDKFMEEASCREEKLKMKKPKSFHKLRIAMKKLRYSIKASESILGEQKDILSDLKIVQDHLGQIQDLTNFIKDLKKFQNKKNIKMKTIIQDMKMQRKSLMQEFIIIAKK